MLYLLTLNMRICLTIATCNCIGHNQLKWKISNVGKLNEQEVEIVIDQPKQQIYQVIKDNRKDKKTSRTNIR